MCVGLLYSANHRLRQRQSHENGGVGTGSTPTKFGGSGVRRGFCAKPKKLW